MSNIPEVTLQRTIINGIRHIRRNPTLLDTIFAGQTAEELQQIKDYILEQSIGFSMHYPRDQDIKVPSIVLTLLSDNESDGLLGDVLGTGIPQIHNADTLGGHGASTSNLGGLSARVISNVRVDRVETQDGVDTLYWESIYSPQIINAFAEAPTGCYTVHVIRGAGAGQTAMISRISNNSLDIEGTFDQQLDSSSYIDIRATEELNVEGQPSRSYTDGEDVVNKGAFYEARYRLHVLGSTQFEVLFLYAILKAVLLSQRIYLEEQGLHGLAVQGTEFAPSTEYTPNVVYSRAMNITFKYVFCYTEPLETFDTIEINLATNNVFNGGTCGILNIEIDI